jgi:hypothetical protein
MKKKKETAKLSVKGLAISLGAVGAIYVFALGLYGMAGKGLTMMNMMGSMYMGYGPTFLGSIIGAIYGFIDGAIAGAIIAWIYNKVVSKK